MGTYRCDVCFCAVMQTGTSRVLTGHRIQPQPMTCCRTSSTSTLRSLPPTSPACAAAFCHSRRRHRWTGSRYRAITRSSPPVSSVSSRQRTKRRAHQVELICHSCSFIFWQKFCIRNRFKMSTTCIWNTLKFWLRLRYRRCYSLDKNGVFRWRCYVTNHHGRRKHADDVIILQKFVDALIFIRVHDAPPSSISPSTICPMPSPLYDASPIRLLPQTTFTIDDHYPITIFPKRLVPSVTISPGKNTSIMLRAHLRCKAARC